MNGLELALGYLSGLRFLAPDLPLPTLVGTTVLVNLCDASMCWLFARNNGYPKNLWTAAGFLFGVWAVAVLIVLPKREKRVLGESTLNPVSVFRGPPP